MRFRQHPKNCPSLAPYRACTRPGDGTRAAAMTSVFESRSHRRDPAALGLIHSANRSRLGKGPIRPRNIHRYKPTLSELANPYRSSKLLSCYLRLLPQAYGLRSPSNGSCASIAEPGSSRSYAARRATTLAEPQGSQSRIPRGTTSLAEPRGPRGHEAGGAFMRSGTRRSRRDVVRGATMLVEPHCSRSCVKISTAPRVRKLS